MLFSYKFINSLLSVLSIYGRTLLIQQLSDQWTGYGIIGKENRCCYLLLLYISFNCKLTEQERQANFNKNMPNKFNC